MSSPVVTLKEKTEQLLNLAKQGCGLDQPHTQILVDLVVNLQAAVESRNDPSQLAVDTYISKLNAARERELIENIPTKLQFTNKLFYNQKIKEVYRYFLLLSDFIEDFDITNDEVETVIKSTLISEKAKRKFNVYLDNIKNENERSLTLTNYENHLKKALLTERTQDELNNYKLNIPTFFKPVSHEDKFTTSSNTFINNYQQTNHGVSNQFTYSPRRETNTIQPKKAVKFISERTDRARSAPYYLVKEDYPMDEKRIHPTIVPAVDYINSTNEKENSEEENYSVENTPLQTYKSKDVDNQTPQRSERNKYMLNTQEKKSNYDDIRSNYDVAKQFPQRGEKYGVDKRISQRSEKITYMQEQKLQNDDDDKKEINEFNLMSKRQETCVAKKPDYMNLQADKVTAKKTNQQGYMELPDVNFLTQERDLENEVVVSTNMKTTNYLTETTGPTDTDTETEEIEEKISLPIDRHGNIIFKSEDIDTNPITQTTESQVPEIITKEDIDTMLDELPEVEFISAAASAYIFGTNEEFISAAASAYLFGTNGNFKNDPVKLKEGRLRNVVKDVSIEGEKRDESNLQQIRDIDDNSERDMDIHNETNRTVIEKLQVNMVKDEENQMRNPTVTLPKKELKTMINSQSYLHFPLAKKLEVKNVENISNSQKELKIESTEVSERKKDVLCTNLETFKIESIETETVKTIEIETTPIDNLRSETIETESTQAETIETLDNSKLESIDTVRKLKQDMTVNPSLNKNAIIIEDTTSDNTSDNASDSTSDTTSGITLNVTQNVYQDVIQDVYREVMQDVMEDVTTEIIPTDSNISLSLLKPLTIYDDNATKKTVENESMSITKTVENECKIKQVVEKKTNNLITDIPNFKKESINYVTDIPNVIEERIAKTKQDQDLWKIEDYEELLKRIKYKHIEENNLRNFKPKQDSLKHVNLYDDVIIEEPNWLNTSHFIQASYLKETNLFTAVKFFHYSENPPDLKRSYRSGKYTCFAETYLLNQSTLIKLYLQVLLVILVELWITNVVVKTLISVKTNYKFTDQRSIKSIKEPFLDAFTNSKIEPKLNQHQDEKLSEKYYSIHCSNYTQDISSYSNSYPVKSIILCY